MSKTGRPGDAYGRGMENTLTPDRTDDHSGSADDRDILDTLTSVLARTTGLIGEVRSQDLALPTPCTDFDVRDLLEHMTTWIQVFDATVNDRPLPFDPMTHTVGGRYAEVFGIAADGVLTGLHTNGWDRPMTMTGSPLPGQVVLAMLQMEYLGHGWDLSRATGSADPYTDHEAEVALAAARSIVSPEYRGTGMFGPEVILPPGAPVMDRCMAFVGRDPAWIA